MPICITRLLIAITYRMYITYNASRRQCRSDAQ
jgi:hypothetical protein